VTRSVNPDGYGEDMIRRSFRSGWRLGLLAGLAIAIYKAIQARQAQPEIPARDPWPPVAPPAPVAVPATPPAATQARVEAAAARAATSPAPAPAPRAAPAPKPATEPARAWVEPSEGACPTTHPIKAKLSSKIFHLPGMFAYERTNADRCYASEEAAEADGLHKAKR
jgi:hypothetical protein